MTRRHGGLKRMHGTQGPRWLVLAALLVAMAARAAPPKTPPKTSGNGQAKGRAPVERKSEAEALLARGIAARLAGDLGAARQALTAAYRLAPAPAVLRELGLLAGAEQRPIEAYDLLRRYLTETEASALPDPGRAEIQKLVAGPPPPSGRLLVLGDPGALVSIDGHLVGVLPLSTPLLLSADEHKLRVEQRAGTAEAQIQVPAFRMAEVRVGQSGSRALLVEL